MSIYYDHQSISIKSQQFIQQQKMHQLRKSYYTCNNRSALAMVGLHSYRRTPVVAPIQAIHSSLLCNHTLALLHNRQIQDAQQQTSRFQVIDRLLQQQQKQKQQREQLAQWSFATANSKRMEPSKYDVLLGRGGRSNHHSGNKRYRQLIRMHRGAYKDLVKYEKTRLSISIVRAIHDLGGQFLEYHGEGKPGYYEVVPFKKAVEKTSQWLRENRTVTKAAAATAATALLQLNRSEKHGLHDCLQRTNK